MGLGLKILIGIVVATAALTSWSFYKTTGKNGENKNEKGPNPSEADGRGGKNGN